MIDLITEASVVGNLGTTPPAAPGRPAVGAAQVVDLGPQASYAELPAPLTIANRSYYLIRTPDSGYRLVSTACPHQGGTIVDVGACFECPQHGWRFDRTTGQCLNVPSQRLSSLPVVVENGRLLCEM